jgi:hypothetical protein
MQNKKKNATSADEACGFYQRAQAFDKDLNYRHTTPAEEGGQGSGRRVD